MRHSRTPSPPHLLSALLLLGLATGPASSQFPAEAEAVRLTSIGSPGDTGNGAGSVAIAYSPPRDLFLVVWQAEDPDFPVAPDEWELLASLGARPVGNPRQDRQS